MFQGQQSLAAGGEGVSGDLLHQVVDHAAAHHTKHNIKQAVVKAQHGSSVARAAAHAVGGSGLQAQGGPGGLGSTSAAEAPPAAEEDEGQGSNEAAEHILVLAQGPVHEVAHDDHRGDEPQGAVQVKELVAGGAETRGMEAQELPGAVQQHGDDLLGGVVLIEEAGADDHAQHIAQDQAGQQRLDAGPGVVPGAGGSAAGHVDAVALALGEVGHHEVAGGDGEDQQHFAGAEEPVAALHPVAQAAVAAHGDDPAGVEADDGERDQKAPNFNGHISFFLCGLHDYTSIYHFMFCAEKEVAVLVCRIIGWCPAPR